MVLGPIHSHRMPPSSGDVYFIANSSLGNYTQSMTDTSLSYPSIVHFNGDDALIIVNGTDTIDVIGVPGVDRSSSWTVGTGSTQNHTLVRKATVDMGSTDWTTVLWVGRICFKYLGYRCTFKQLSLLLRT